MILYIFKWYSDGLLHRLYSSSSVLITILITHTHSPQISVTMTYSIPLQSSLNKHLINYQTWSGCCGMSVLSKSLTALCCFPKKEMDLMFVLNIQVYHVSIMYI